MLIVFQIQLFKYYSLILQSCLRYSDSLILLFQFIIVSSTIHFIVALFTDWEFGLSLIIMIFIPLKILFQLLIVLSFKFTLIIVRWILYFYLLIINWFHQSKSIIHYFLIIIENIVPIYLQKFLHFTLFSLLKLWVILSGYVIQFPIMTATHCVVS